MTRLRQTDLAALLGVSSAFSAADDLDELRTQAVSGIMKLIPSDTASWMEWDFGSESWTGWDFESEGVTSVDAPESTTPHREPDMEFWKIMDEHPIYPFRQAGGVNAVKLSDFVSRRELHRLELYEALYKPAGLGYELAAVLSDRGRLRVVVACARGPRDFSERDRLVLDLVRGHLAQAYKVVSSRLAMRYAVEVAVDGGELDSALLVADPDGEIMFATAAAQRLLDQYFGHRREERLLPPAIAQQIARAVDEAANVAPVSERSDRTLRTEIYTELGDWPVILLVEHGADDLDLGALASLGLTRREAEILSWVMRGKTNPEIALTLYVSPRTVQKHLEHVFAKLDVRTRTEAAALALSACHRQR